MLLRRFMGHLQAQNWFAVGLDIIVVIVGVYLGIFIGNEAEKAQRLGESTIALQSLKTDIENDLQSIDRIITIHGHIIAAYDELIAELLKPELDKEAIFAADNKVSVLENPTFFPNSSTYSLMLNRGDLTVLSKEELRRTIASLFENSYKRVEAYSAMSDINSDTVFRTIRSYYFDVTSSSLVVENDIDLARLRAGLYSQCDYSYSYQNFLIKSVRPVMVEAHKAIVDYQTRSK